MCFEVGETAVCVRDGKIKTGRALLTLISSPLVGVKEEERVKRPYDFVFRSDGWA